MRIKNPLVLLIRKVVSPLRLYLKYAKLNKSLEEYVYMVYKIILLIIPSIFLISFILFYMIIKVAVIFSIMTSILISFFSIFIILTIFYFYPIIRMQSRGKKIDNVLPLATIYMSAIASSGANPVAIFEYLSTIKEFGEVSEDCKEIVYHSKVLGVDLPNSLEKIANRSPSKEWRDILYGLKTLLVEGGDIYSFLYTKSRNLIAEFKRRVEEYSRSLSLILEIYITLIIIGAIFTLIITIILSLVTPGISEFLAQLQLFIVLFGLPISSIIFVFIIKSLSPFET